MFCSWCPFWELTIVIRFFQRFLFKGWFRGNWKESAQRRASFACFDFLRPSKAPLFRPLQQPLAADSFTGVRAVCSALCAHSDPVALLRIFPPDCPNKPGQTGRRQRADVTHSSEPWRLSARRRSGGLHGDVKQERSHSSIHLWAEAPGTNRLWAFCRPFITLKQRDQITGQRTCSAAAVGRGRTRHPRC